MVKRHEATISLKLKEIASLESQRKASVQAQEVSDQAKAALQVKAEALTSQIATRDRERQDQTSARQKLEKELDDLRKTMAAKSSEDSKRQEADRSREAEMSRVREQAGALQKALDDQRDAAQSLANRLRVDVEGLKSSHTAAQRDLKTAQAALKDREGSLMQKQSEVDRAEERRRQVEAELSAVREQVKATEDRLRSAVKGRDVSEHGYRWAANADEYRTLIENCRAHKSAMMISKMRFLLLKVRRPNGSNGLSKCLDSSTKSRPDGSGSSRNYTIPTSNLPVIEIQPCKRSGK